MFTVDPLVIVFSLSKLTNEAATYPLYVFPLFLTEILYQYGFINQLYVNAPSDLTPAFTVTLSFLLSVITFAYVVFGPFLTLTAEIA